ADEALAESQATVASPAGEAGQPAEPRGAPAEAPPGSGPDQAQKLASAEAGPAAEASALAGEGTEQIEPGPPAGGSPDPCDQPPPPPLPGPGAAVTDRWRAFREPLPPAALWNPPGPRRVGLQAGHWLVEQAPDEQKSLGGGSAGGGK